MSEDPFIDETLYEDVTPPEGARDRAETAVRRFVLAGLGAVASAVDTANDTFERLVDRGARVQGEWEDRAEDMRRHNAGTSERVRDYVRSGMNAFLDTVNVPNKADVDTINVKLNILTRKLDDLQLHEVTTHHAATTDPTVPGVSDPI